MSETAVRPGSSGGGTGPVTVARRRRLGQPELLLLALLLMLASGRVLVPLFDHPALRTWATMFVAISVQSLPFLVLGVVLAAGISALLSERVLRRVVPERAAYAVPVAGLAGAALPGCECASVPVAGSLIRRGVAPAAALTFLLAAPAINPVVLVSTAVAFPGRPEFVLARFTASLLTSVLVGWLWLWRGADVPLRLPSAGAAHGHKGLGGFLSAVQHDFLHTAGFLVLGAMIAASVNTFVPRDVLDAVAGHPVLGVLVMAAFAFVVALCSETDAFVAASLSAFSDTARLAFLVVGPAMDVKLAVLEAGAFGRAFAQRFVPLVVVVAVGSAVVVARVLL